MQNTYAQDQVVVVTGAASGIGLRHRPAPREAGHRVALLDRQGDAVRQAADFLAAEGATVLAAEVDVTDRAAVDDAMAMCARVRPDRDHRHERRYRRVPVVHRHHRSTLGPA